MDGNEILKRLREEVVDAKQNGHQQVTLESLERLLAVLEESQVTGKEPTEFDLALYNARATANLAEYNAGMAIDLETMRSVVLSGQNALKSLMLINGGAVVALLAFLSHIWDKALTTGTIRGFNGSTAVV